MKLYPCPADTAAGEDPESGNRTCGRNFPTENGAVMHAINTHDEHHDYHVPDKPTAYDHLVEYRVERAGSVDPPDDHDLDEATDPSPDDPDEIEADGGDVDAEVHEPTMPEADDDESSTEPCPNCGTDTGATEAEIEEYIDEHGEAYCSSCGHEIRVTDD